ncbi:MAG: MBL fold metallo-hydrolase [Armatimonadota bacterium]|nr:MBL fold metallo-hydrolase [Armatimonadota bacterium]
MSEDGIGRRVSSSPRTTYKMMGGDPGAPPDGTAFQIKVLASGSAGNAILARAGDTCLLVDAGLSADALARALAPLSLTLSDLTAILLTHEHDDHARGAAGISRQAGIPIFSTETVARACREMFADARVETFRPEVPFRIGPFTIEAFPLPHDAIDPVGFHLSLDGARAVVALDFGDLEEPLLERAKGAQLLILEANYDLHLLREGPYPWFVKNRILSRRGHLSNDAAAKAAVASATGNLQTVLLVHLSEVNNLAPLARDTVKWALEREGLGHVRVEVVRPNGQSPLLVI